MMSGATASARQSVRNNRPLRQRRRADRRGDSEPPEQGPRFAQLTSGRFNRTRRNGLKVAEPADKPGSVRRLRVAAVIPLGASSPIRSSNLPGDSAGRLIVSLFGLAPGGVCRAGLLPDSRCALTAPFHPCRPAEAVLGGIFLLHFPSALAAQALPGTVPCGARTFLGIPKDDATAWPTPPRAFYGFRRQMTPKIARAQTSGPAPLLPIPCRCRGAPLTKGGYGMPMAPRDRS